jgi:uroporphyrinogen-III decarboxylase
MQPTLEAMSAIAKRHGAFYYHHSCGAVSELIPLLIKTGVDVLDPLQVRAKGMVPSRLKTEFGHKICFSGGVDEQELLPNGTAEHVRDGVQSLLDIMAPGGGYFVGPTHNFQCDIPTQNIVAMYEAARSWRY